MFVEHPSPTDTNHIACFHLRITISLYYSSPLTCGVAYASKEMLRNNVVDVISKHHWLLLNPQHDITKAEAKPCSFTSHLSDRHKLESFLHVKSCSSFNSE